jgi:hypothetical protein
MSGPFISRFIPFNSPRVQARISAGPRTFQQFHQRLTAIPDHFGIHLQTDSRTIYSCFYLCCPYICLVYCCALCIVVVNLCVFAVLCVCIAVFTLDAGLLARSQYSEGPATGHLNTGFSRFPCAYKQTLRRFPTFQVATTRFSCSPPDLNLLVTNFMFCLHVK